MSQVFNFAEATIPTEQVSDYINSPGYYKGKVLSAELVQPEGKNAFLQVVFETDKGKVSERFFITDKTLGRLKALYEAIWKKDLTQTFTSVQSVADFFIAALGKSVEITIRVIAERTGEKVFHKLPFANFIVEGEEPRVVETTDSDYSDWVVNRKVTTPATGDTIQQQNAPVSNSASSWTPSEDDSDSLPF